MRGTRSIVAIALLTMVLALGSVRLAGSPLGDLPAFIPPVFATSCGQGTGVSRVWESCDRLGITCWAAPELRMGDLGAICCADAGCPFGGVVFVVVGIDPEALHALAIDIAYESARCQALLERANELGMLVILALTGAPSPAAREANLELFAALAPAADLLIAWGATAETETVDALSYELEIPRVELGAPHDLDALFSQLRGATE